MKIMRPLLWNQLSIAERRLVLARPQQRQENNQTMTADGEPQQFEQMVSEIIRQIRLNGDMALRQFTGKFDGVRLDDFLVSPAEIGASEALAAESKQAIAIAWKNIDNFHQQQTPQGYQQDHDGIVCGRRYISLQRVGLYIPGGSAPLVSTLLMLAVPARLAGCRNISLATPPLADGRIHPALLFAAKFCGIDTIYKVGGAQAIAALAYGTESIAKVDKIFGPGNKWVTEAKMQISRDPAGAAMDMPAGPSEVLIIADADAHPDFVASDLLAQCEHDADSHAVLITTSLAVAERAIECIASQSEKLSRQNILEKSLANAAIVVAEDLETCFALSNQYAPEHLILQIKEPRKYLERIYNAGSVFLGPWSPEALGDYASGPNHVLPTFGFARSYSGLGVESFMKSITFQEVSKQGLLNLAPTVEHLAKIEGLDAHGNSVALRRKKLLPPEA